jgi:hypothetical protein
MMKKYLFFVILISLSTTFLGLAYSDVKLYKRIDLSQHSVLNCRMTVGDMTGDGMIDFLFFDGARTIKAFDHDGQLLWEKFNPNEPGCEQDYHNYSFQIYDIDLDGAGEAIIFWDIDGVYSLAVVDGRTGTIETSTAVVFGPLTQGEYYKKHSTAVANVRGLDFPQDILAFQVHTMDLFAYAYTDTGLYQIWHWKTDHPSYSSGRWAYPYDFDNDGKDEVIAGVDVLDDDGHRLWKLPIIVTHPDAIVCGDIDGNSENGKEIAAVEDGGGLYMYDTKGTILWTKTDLPSEPQELYLGNFRSDVPGLELLVFAEDMSNFVHLYDHEGHLIAETSQQTGPQRRLCYQIDWDGDRTTDEIYSRRGIFDGYFNRLSYSMDYNYRQTSGVSEFPPIIIDVQGDHREEVIWYDDNEIIIVANSDTLGGDTEPHPWNFLSYRLRYANIPPDAAMFFDWGTLTTAVDTISPNPPTQLRSPSQGEDTIDIEWNTPAPASDGDGASFYRVFRNDLLVATTVTTNYNDTGLMANNHYAYAIFSIDDNDNQSTSGATGVFKTLTIFYPDVTVDTELIAKVVAGTQYSVLNEKRVPLLLYTSKQVTSVPTPLVLKESDASLTYVTLHGEIPGQTFTGNLILTNDVADGLGFFLLQDNALVGLSGSIGDSQIAEGDSICIDKTPPSIPSITQIQNL